jgi:hypothetical protein
MALVARRAIQFQRRRVHTQLALPSRLRIRVSSIHWLRQAAPVHVARPQRRAAARLQLVTPVWCGCADGGSLPTARAKSAPSRQMPRTARLRARLSHGLRQHPAAFRDLERCRAEDRPAAESGTTPAARLVERRPVEPASPRCCAPTVPSDQLARLVVRAVRPSARGHTDLPRATVFR